MSRFDKDNTTYEPLNLTETDCHELIDLLKNFLQENRSILNRHIQSFLDSKKEYSIIELSDSFVLILRRSHTNQAHICVGYPFRLYAEDVTQDFLNHIQTPDCINLSLHLRGKLLRDRQRQMLMTMLQEDHNRVEYIPVTSKEDFQGIAHKAVCTATQHNSVCAYIDPYDFIGDSIVGLYFLDYFVRTYGIKKPRVLSRAYQHTDFFYPSSPKNKAEFDNEITTSSLVVMPDLIDNHFRHTMDFLHNVHSTNLFVFIISRNLIIQFEGETVNVFHYTNDDILLKSESVQEYMDSALQPFVYSERTKKTTKQNVRPGAFCPTNEILINPFSSDVLKDLPPDRIVQIIKSCRSQTFKTIYIAIGKDGDREKQWMRKFEELNQPLDCETIPIKDRGLADLAQQISRLKIRFALSVDTAISHLLTRMGVSNVTIYNDGFWDNESPQSLSAESPLGFCNVANHQLPVIQPKCGTTYDFLQYIADCLESCVTNFSQICDDKICVRDLITFQKKLNAFLQRMRHTNNLVEYEDICKEYNILKEQYSKSPATGWIFEVYNPIYLLEGIVRQQNARIIPLIHSAWRVSPINKIPNLIQ